MTPEEERVTHLQAVLERNRAHAARALWEMHHAVQADLSATQAQLARSERRTARTERRLGETKERLARQRRRAQRLQRRLRRAEQEATELRRQTSRPLTTRLRAALGRLLPSGRG